MAGFAGGGARARKRKRKVARTLDQIKRNAKACGSHWFDKDTMRFFRTRLSGKVYPAKSGRCSFFVTSEQGPHGGRAYSVRKACGCKIDTVGEFQGHSTLKRAQTAARKAAARS